MLDPRLVEQSIRSLAYNDWGVSATMTAAGAGPCLSLGKNNYFSAIGEAMETSCNRDSLGSVGLVCRNSTTEAANRH